MSLRVNCRVAFTWQILSPPTLGDHGPITNPIMGPHRSPPFSHYYSQVHYGLANSPDWKWPCVIDVDDVRLLLCYKEQAVSVSSKRCQLMSLTAPYNERHLGFFGQNLAVIVF